MEIKKTSWHYRFLEWCDQEPWTKKTLCDYMLSLIYTLTLRPLLIALGFAVIVSLGLGAMVAAYTVLKIMIWMPIAYFAGSPVDEVDIRFIGFAWAALATVVGVLCAILSGGIFGRWLQDRKEKKCTRITFK